MSPLGIENTLAYCTPASHKSLSFLLLLNAIFDPYNGRNPSYLKLRNKRSADQDSDPLKVLWTWILSSSWVCVILATRQMDCGTMQARSNIAFYIQTLTSPSNQCLYHHGRGSYRSTNLTESSLNQSML